MSGVVVITRYIKKYDATFSAQITGKTCIRLTIEHIYNDYGEHYITVFNNIPVASINYHVRETVKIPEHERMIDLID